jgi:hypothetical protein
MFCSGPLVRLPRSFTSFFTSISTSLGRFQKYYNYGKLQFFGTARTTDDFRLINSRFIHDQKRDKLGSHEAELYRWPMLGGQRSTYY